MTQTVRVAHQYKAAPEAVFDVFPDEKRAAKFLFATRPRARPEADPRIGSAGGGGPRWPGGTPSPASRELPQGGSD